jgi:hypothetical protein
METGSSVHTNLRVAGYSSSYEIQAISLKSGSGNTPSAIRAKHNATGKEILLGTPSYAAYVVLGTIGPFTASHDGIMSKADNPDPGDILVDTALFAVNGVSDSICFNAPSSSAMQRGVVGVFVSRTNIAEDSFIAADPGELITTVGKDGEVTEAYGPSPLLQPVSGTHDLVTMNSVGEGQINVCGQNGNIEIGDLIVTSDMPGKGMKQDDDIVRNYTVAKSREAVTFSSPEEVKQIACIYLCG